MDPVWLADTQVIRKSAFRKQPFVDVPTDFLTCRSTSTSNILTVSDTMPLGKEEAGKSR